MSAFVANITRTPATRTHTRIEASNVTMAIPESIIEATEKGMVGENLLCSNVPSLEKTSKLEVSTRAVEVAKSSENANEKRRTSDGHVKIKDVDV